MTDSVYPPTPPRPHWMSLWFPVVLWCSLIFYLSHQPHLRITQEWWDIIARKIAHVMEYAILTLLLIRALSGSTRWPTHRIWLVSGVLAVLYACSDEVHQHFVAGRVGSPVDVLIDALGILGAWLMARSRFVKVRDR